MEAASAIDGTPARAGPGSVNPGDLHFRYEITGDTPDWRPRAVFDDGKSVYILFPDSVAFSELPPLFGIGPKNTLEPMNYRVSGHMYVADALFETAELRLGSRPQTVVRIHRKAGAESPKSARAKDEGGYD